MRRIQSIDRSWGITPVRLVLAIILMTAGWQKLGNGMAATAESFAKMGIPAASIAAPFIVGLELVGGALLLLGLFTRPIGLLFTIQFLVITFYVKSPAQGLGPIRLDLMILASSVLMLLAGPGRAALDNLWLERDRTADIPPARAVERRVA